MLELGLIRVVTTMTPTAALAVSSLAEEASVKRLGSGSGFLKEGTRVPRVTKGGEIGRGEVMDEKKSSIYWWPQKKVLIEKNHNRN